MKKKDFAYTRRKDISACTEGFYEHSEKYMTANNIKPFNNFFYSEIASNHVTYFGNFAVGSKFLHWMRLYQVGTPHDGCRWRVLCALG